MLSLRSRARRDGRAEVVAGIIESLIVAFRDQSPANDKEGLQMTRWE